MQLAENQDGCLASSCCMSSSKFSSFPLDKVEDFLKEHRSERKIDSVDDKSIQVKIVEEMNSLSSEERVRLVEEINGVPSPIDEDQDSVSKALFDLDEAIKKNNDDRWAYDYAMKLKPQLVNDRDFRLMFLRAEHFNATLAAKRLILHFKVKLGMFGKDKLVKRITVDDLDEDDRDCLSTGASQLLLSKDQAGRAVFMCIPKYLHFKKVSNQHRIFWYLMMKAVEEDENVQRMGMLMVIDVVGMHTFSHELREAISNGGLVHDALPFRLAAFHFCYDHDILVPIMFLIQRALPMKQNLVFRAHKGSFLETHFSLMTFGIPTSILPIDENGELKYEHLENFRKEHITALRSNEIQVGNQVALACQFESKLCIESQRPSSTSSSSSSPEPVIVESRAERTTTITSSSSTTTTPMGSIIVTDNDVLLGKGRYRQSHPANTKLSNMIEMKSTAFKKATKFEKTCISSAIVKTISCSGGRFLKRSKENKNEWIEVSVEEARVAVSHRFRNKTLLRFRNESNPTPSTKKSATTTTTTTAAAATTADTAIPSTMKSSSFI